MVAYPYRVGEVALANIPEIKPTTKFGLVRMNERGYRPPCRAAPFGHIYGALPPTPDITDSPTLLAGAMKRFLFQPPTPDPAVLKRFSAFVENWIENNLDPLPVTEDVSFETWVDGINHPETRKNELRNLWKSLNGQIDQKRHAVVKMFMKDESYAEFKHGRAINSRHDAYKCATGPIFHAIEKKLFDLKWFIKYVPVEKRPSVIFERLYREGAKYYASDFTSFESLFTADIMNACEVHLYRYMTRNLSEAELFMEHVGWKVNQNVIQNKNFSVKVGATRMSGEMDTSLGNGFSNLMMWLFLAAENGAEIDGFVEGDDGIFRVEGAAPTTEQFASLGMVIKVEEHSQLNTASFCGNVFDVKIGTQITEPRYAAVNTLWIPGKYSRAKKTVQLALLRSKALSLHHQYPRHPILSALSHRLLYLTRSISLDPVLRQGYMDSWMRDQLINAIKFDTDLKTKTDIPIENRLLVEELYNVTIAEQLEIEDAFDNFELGDTLKLNWEVPTSWQQFYDTYVAHAPCDARQNEPGLWPQNHPVALPLKPKFADQNAGWEKLFYLESDGKTDCRHAE